MVTAVAQPTNMILNEISSIHRTGKPIFTRAGEKDPNLTIFDPKTNLPSLIDLHLNGLQDSKCGLNTNFWKTPSDKQILELRRYLFAHGVKSFVPTLITASPQSIDKSLGRIAEHQKEFWGDEKSSLEQGLAHIAGVHIEGGYSSRLGSHPKEYATALNPEIADQLATKYPGLIKLWTICPRVDKDGRHVEVQKKHGIVTAYGHSQANYKEAMEAFKRHGVRLVNHWGLCMPIFTGNSEINREAPSLQDIQRLRENIQGTEKENEAGLGKAAFDHPEVLMMAICGSDKDCKGAVGDDKDLHISPVLIKELAKTGRLILTTDATAEIAPGKTESNQSRRTRNYKLGGGLVALDKHAWHNARILAGLTDEEIKRATETLPEKALSLKHQPAKTGFFDKVCSWCSKVFRTGDQSTKVNAAKANTSKEAANKPTPLAA